MTQKTSSSTDATPTGSHFYHHHHQNSKPHFIITPETPLTALLIISNTILPLYNQMGLVSLPKTAQKPTLQKHPLLQETRGKYSIKKKKSHLQKPHFFTVPSPAVEDLCCFRETQQNPMQENKKHSYQAIDRDEKMICSSNLRKPGPTNHPPTLIAFGFFPSRRFQKHLHLTKSRLFLLPLYFLSRRK